MNQPDRPVSINVFEQIDSICKEFRRQSKKGGRPQIEEFLDDSVGQDAQPTLFRNLLHIDVEYRRRGQQQPTSKEYIDRFPEFARLIRQAFLEDTMMSLQSMHSTPGGDFTASLDGLAQDVDNDFRLVTPAANRLGDYMLIQELGRGGFGVVYEAQHAQRQNRVALKTLPAVGQRGQALDEAERLHKFRREFRSLADINHPNLVGMQTLEVDGNQWFFTMDLIDGEDFLSYVRPEESLDESRLRAVLPQLVSGIMALHAQHIIHRDLKPSNVMVDREGNVTILDFGLVVELEQQTDQTMSLQSSRFAGTPLYAAPEQITGNSTSESDWYAMGVILFEALTGERPFHGSAFEVFEQKKNQPTARLANRDDLPNDLTILSDGLLQRDPQERPSPLDIAKVFSIPSESAATEATDLDFRATIDGSGQVLIGREKQLAELNQLKQKLIDERPPLAVFITGKSGEGKTSLAEKFLEPLRLGTDVLVLSGRCYDRESVPFKAIDSFIDSLVGYLRGRSDEEVNAVLPEDIRMLAHLFPVLGRVKAIAERNKQPVSQLDSKQIRARAFNALGELLTNIGSQLPVVMFIDDLQWGDVDSAEVLFRMLTSAEPPALLLVGSYRSDEADESPFIKSWESTCSNVETRFLRPNVVVGPLDHQQCLSLMIHRFGNGDTVREQAAELYTATGGNPYFLDQLIESFDPDTGSFAPKPLSEVIANRLSKLPADAVPLLNVIAVSGSATSLPEACQAAGLSESAYATVTHMRTERLVRLIGAEENQMVDTYHDKIRETTLDCLDKTLKRDLHRAVGDTIESGGEVNGDEIYFQLNQDAEKIVTPGRVFDLAYHYCYANELQKAAAYSLLAADQAKSQFALSLAEEHYNNAVQFAPTEAVQIKNRIQCGLGEVLLQSGQYEKAEDVLQMAIKTITKPDQRMPVSALLAALSFFTKSVNESGTVLEDLLRDLKVAVPRSGAGLLLSVAKEVGWHWIFKLIPKRFYQRRRPANPSERLLIQLLTQIGPVYVQNSVLRTFWSALIALNRARRFPDHPALADAMTYFGVCQMCSLGMAVPGERVIRKALRLATKNDDLSRQANAGFWLNFGLFMAGQPARAVDNMAQVQGLYTRIGDAYKISFTNCFWSIIATEIGMVRESIEKSKSAFEKSVQVGQSRQAQYALFSWSRAACGDLPLDQLNTCFQESRDSVNAKIVLRQAETLWHWRHGRTLEATETAEEAYQLFRKNWFFFAFGVESVTYLARALRLHAEAIATQDAIRSQKLMRRALGLAKGAKKLIRFSPLTRSNCLRELAVLYDHFGQHKKALKLAQASRDHANLRSQKLEYSRSLLVSGQIGKKLGVPDADVEITKASAMLAELEKQIQETNVKIFGRDYLPPPVSKTKVL